MISSDEAEFVDDFTSFGVHAFTTTRLVGSFGTSSDEPVRDVMARWDRLRATAAAQGVRRLATASQVHGARVLVHIPGWEGWLRSAEADGHVSTTRGTAMAVTIADCVPVFIVHPSGAVAMLHSGWRGTSARIIEQGIAALAHRGFPAVELRINLGPAICGRCYEVSAEVVKAVTGEDAPEPRAIDLRRIIADQARAMGVRHISISERCTKCDNARFFSHRAGDRGRQVSVVFAEP